MKLVFKTPVQPYADKNKNEWTGRKFYENLRFFKMRKESLGKNQKLLHYKYDNLTKKNIDWGIGGLGTKLFRNYSVGF